MQITLAEFEARVDEIEFDPRVRLKRLASAAVAREMNPLSQGIHLEQAVRFASGPLSELLAAAKESIERGDFAIIDKHLGTFVRALRQQLQNERDHGELKPITPASEIKTHASALLAKLYRGAEQSAIECLMKDRERILNIGWHEIKTDRQVILRSSLPSANRPVGFRNGPSWRSSFVSEAQIAEAIDAEWRAAQPVRASGPSPWIE